MLRRTSPSVLTLILLFVFIPVVAGMQHENKSDRLDRLADLVSGQDQKQAIDEEKASGWIYISQTNESYAFVNPKNIQRLPNSKIKIWVKMRRIFTPLPYAKNELNPSSKSTAPPDEDEEPYVDYSLIYLYLDCSLRLHRVLGAVEHNNDGTHSSAFSAGRLLPVIPGTIGERTFDYACRQEARSRK